MAKILEPCEVIATLVDSFNNKTALVVNSLLFVWYEKMLRGPLELEIYSLSFLFYEHGWIVVVSGPYCW